MESQGIYNVVVLGKAGVGKSSLINYMFGRRVRDTGVGRAVTARGFHKEVVSMNGQSVAIFDSGGLEASNVRSWIATLQAELITRGPERSADQWFHTVLYCISAGGSRADGFEIDIIKRLLNAQIQVIVTLTKCDQAPRSDATAILREVEAGIGRSLPSAQVCSVSGEVRGRPVETFGLDNLQSAIARTSLETIQLRLPSRCVAVLQAQVDEWASQQGRWIERNWRIFGNDTEYEHLKKEVQALRHRLVEKEIRDVVVSEIYSALKVYAGRANVSEVHSAINIAREMRWTEANDLSGYSGIFDFTMNVLCGFLPNIFTSNREVLRNSLSRESERIKEDLKLLRPAIDSRLRGMFSGLQ